MQKIFLFISFSFFATISQAQETVLPAKEQKGSYYLTNATIHVGNGQVISKGTIKVTNGKIEAVGNNISISADVPVTDLQGQDLYPGLILPNSSLGLVEISAVRASWPTTPIQKSSIRSDLMAFC
jgi:imidazolonepropionase-like amidohydrolase